MPAKDKRKGKLTKDSVTLLPCFYFVELPILASSVLSLYFLELTDMFKPVLSGYTCHDRSLSLPYVEPTRESVPLLMLLSLAFAGPTAAIMIGEGILYCCLSRRRDGIGTESDINAAGCNFNSYVRRAVRFVGVHVFGLCATALITDIIQLSTGYHAPYFLTVCKPNYTTLNTSCEENSFVLQDICSGTELDIINAGRKSFPSQHATLAAFAAVYVSMYFNATLSDSSKLLKPALVFSFVMCAIICGLTRIIQYKNHAIDVYLGFVIGGGIAAYLGLYAVGNFQPSEEPSGPKAQPREPRQQPQTNTQQEPARHAPPKSSNGIDGVPPRADSTLSRSHRNAGSLTALQRATADVEMVGPRIPLAKESMVTFSNTLPRAHVPTMDEVARRNATIHASVDSARSKQLLSQWKSMNDSHNLSLQVIETEVCPSPQRSMEMRSSSEPAGVGISGEHQGPASQYLKMTNSGPPLPSASSGVPGATRASLPSRPSSSQLVHIPEEAQENGSTSPKGSSARSRWLSVAEKSGTCRSAAQPRLMQVIAMSKQQGLLQAGAKGCDGVALSCTGSIRYKALTEQEPAGIVRVEAHPETGQAPAAPPPSVNGTARWNSQENVGPRQPHELNNLSRGSESSGSTEDSRDPTDRKSGSEGTPHSHPHPLAYSTIRVTPGDGLKGGPEAILLTVNQDSTLRRKGNLILIPERGNSPDNTRNIFYKGTSQNQAFGP